MNAQDQYTRRVIIVVSIAALYVIAWWLSDVFILVFGGLILATALRAGATRIARIAPMAEQGALAVVVVGIVALLAALFWLVGGRVAMQFAELRTALPQALATAGDWLHATPFGLTLLDLVESAKDAGVPWARVAVFTTVAIGGIVNAVLMVALGLYLAVSPDMYYQGLLRLVPTNARRPAPRSSRARGSGRRSRSSPSR